MNCKPQQRAQANKPKMTANVLYLSFDGMSDPLGRSQVLPYLGGLAAKGHRIRIVSLEKSDRIARERDDVARICAASGIEWHPLRYRRSPPVLSGILNLVALHRAAVRLHKQEPADFVHARADLPAIAGLRLKHRFGLPLLFDMRSFWADERAEGGEWDQSKLLYRSLFGYFKRRQRELLAEADEVVTLSEEGHREILAIGARRAEQAITVIPCCADFDVFVPLTSEQRASARQELGVRDDAPLVVHLGSIGCNTLVGEMLDFFACYRERHAGARFLFVAPAGEEAIRSQALRRGLDETVDFRSARREDVARWIGAADLGIMFVRPVWSKKAASPTKLGEMMAVGLPVIANSGVGDVAEIVRHSGGGVVIDRFDADTYRAAIGQANSLQLNAEGIRAQARRWFDLETGITLYDRIYRRLRRPT